MEVKIGCCLEAFNELIRSWTPSAPLEFNLAELRSTGFENWGDWKSMVGVYYFAIDDRIVYVGRALSHARLGGRVFVQITSLEDPEWAGVIEDSRTVLGVIDFKLEHESIASALELHLIKSLKPRFNKRAQ